jgi:hypothetical protein
MKCGVITIEYNTVVPDARLQHQRNAQGSTIGFIQTSLETLLKFASDIQTVPLKVEK